MKLYPLLAVRCRRPGATFAGCEDVSTFRAPSARASGFRCPPHVRVFAADERTTYAAAKAALEPMGYTFQHGGPAQREIDALSHVTGGDEPATARQFTLKAKFDPSLDGASTEVSVKMDEIDEEDSGRNLSRATEVPLTDTSLLRGLLQRDPEEPQASAGGQAIALTFRLPRGGGHVGF